MDLFVLATASYLALSNQPGAHVIASATNTAEVVSYYLAFQPDAIALEWEMPTRLVADLQSNLTQAAPRRDPDHQQTLIA